MKKEWKIALWVLGGLTVVIGVPTTYFAIRRNGIRKRLEEKFNDPSAEDAVGGLDKLLVTGAFNKTTFQNSGKATISRVVAREKAKEVWDNYSSWLSSDMMAIIQAFDGLNHLHDVSKIAYEFYQSYGEELLTVLKNALGDDSGQMNILIGKIKQLPNQ